MLCDARREGSESPCCSRARAYLSRRSDAQMRSNGRLVAVVSFKAAGAGVEGIAFGVPAVAALDRLGLEPAADATDAVLDQPPPPSPAAAPPAVDDLPDPVVPLEPPPPTAVVAGRETRHQDRPRGPRTPTARSLGIAGVIAASVGAAGVGTTYLLFRGGEGSMSQSEFDRLRLANDASWVLLVGGAGLFIAAELLPRQPLISPQPPKPPPQRKPGARPPARGPALFARFGPASVHVGVRH
jgi:hypothetical protein